MIISLCVLSFVSSLFCTTLPLKNTELKALLASFSLFLSVLQFSRSLLLFYFSPPLHHPSFPLHPGGGSEPPLKLTCWKPRSLGLSAAAPPLTSVCVLPYAAVDSLQVFWSHKETSRTHGSLRWHSGTRCGTLPNTMASYNGRGFHTAAESL